MSRLQIKGYQKSHRKIADERNNGYFSLSIDEVSFTYSGTGGSGGGVMSKMGQDTYFGTYERHKSKTCTLTITAIDEFNNTATYVTNDEGVQ